MNLILLLMLALFAVISIKLMAFTITCAVIGFKVGVVALVGLVLWKCLKAVAKK